MKEDSDYEGLLAGAIPKKVKNPKWFGQYGASKISMIYSFVSPATRDNEGKTLF